MKRSSSANTLTCLPRAPILEKVVEDEVEMQPASEVAYLERERKRSVTRQELQVKEKLFQAMVRALVDQTRPASIQASRPGNQEPAPVGSAMPRAAAARPRGAKAPSSLSECMTARAARI